MKIFIILLALHIQAFSQSVDPFAESTKEPARRSQRLAPGGDELKKFDEPSLKEPAPADTADIRFIWIPTFNKPLSIRVTKAGDKVSLRVVRMSGKGGYEWGTIELQKTLVITDQQWASLVALASVDGAREPSQKANKEIRENFADVMSGFDGSTWYLEVRDKNGYTVEGVPNPIIEENADLAKFLKESKLDFKPFLDVCFCLFDLSGLKERPKY